MPPVVAKTNGVNEANSTLVSKLRRAIGLNGGTQVNKVG